MDPSMPAQVLFELIDQDIEYRAKRIKDGIFSEARHLDWTPEQRKTIPAIIRNELDGLISDILGTFDDHSFIMPTVPGGPVGYTIHSVYLAEDGEGREIGYAGGSVKEGPDIKVDNIFYMGMWRDYLRRKVEGGS